MTLINNPFARLGAMPGDDRRTLAEKADEAALLGGGDTDDALNRLMQLNRRIPAELAWLPGATDEAARAFLAYAQALADGRDAKLPPCEGLCTPLAQANALSPLFEAWPADTVDMTLALCLAMDAILSRVTAQETLDAVNADRRAGQWEPVGGVYALNDPLDEQLRRLCAPITRAMNALDERAAASALTRLLAGGADRQGQTLAGAVDPQGCVAQAAIDAYTMRVHERADALRDKIVADAERYGSADRDRIDPSRLSDLKSRVNQWCELTAPLRLTPGTARSDAKSVCSGMRNVVVNFVNKAGSVKREVRESVPVPNGTKIFTITYQSQADTFKSALEITDWLRRSFPEQNQLGVQLAADEALLNQLLKKEDDMVTRARLQAHGRP